MVDPVYSKAQGAQPAQDVRRGGSLAAGGSKPPAKAAAPELRRVQSMAAFASVIEIYLVPDHERLNAQLLEAVAGLRREDPGMKVSNHLGWHSSRDFFSRTEPAFQLLQQHIWQALTSGVRRFWKEFDPKLHRTIHDGWVNVNGKGAFNAPHEHSLHHLSGCYYVSTPESDEESSGVLGFMNPAGPVGPKGWFSDRLIPARLNARPKAGQIILFPSYLLHWVCPNQAEEERVSIAFNLTIAEDAKA